MVTTISLLLGSLVLAAPAVVCQSPEGLAAIELQSRDGQAVYRVLHRGTEAVGWSPLGLRLAGGIEVGGNCEVVASESRDFVERFTQHPGKRSDVVAPGRHTTVRLRERAAPNLTWEVELRAYNDGVAWRYRVPKQAGLDGFRLVEELTELRLPNDADAVIMPLWSFATPYEGRYRREPVGELPQAELNGLPSLFRGKAGGWLAFTEANLQEYSGAYLERRPKGDGFKLRLAPRPDNPKLAVDWTLPHRSPWRVCLLADEVGQMIESDTVLALNEPSVVDDPQWIRPGKTAFPWWNGFALEGIDFEPGLNTATAKHYIDFCAKHGIEYHSLDGVENFAWYGGPIVPYEGAKPTAGTPGLDLPEVLAHAKKKGVRIRLWMHWEAARTHMAEAFPLYEKWGVEGVMLDFVDRDDQPWHRFQREALELAAKHKLTVTLHGVPKPTGLERTYPHLLNHEGVLNLEYNKWDINACSPGHQVTVAFARMLAGPLDFHQGSFRGVRAEDFESRDKAPLVIGGPARTLASYVVYQNHLPMAADSPSAYEGRPELPALAAIPCTWDDTRFVAGDPDRYAALARRSGDEWFLGVMTGDASHRVELPLGFLGDRAYRAEIWCDSGSPSEPLQPSHREATAAESLTFELPAAGGAYVRLTPSK